MYKGFEEIESDDIQSLTQMIIAEREKRLGLIQELIFERRKIKQLEDFIDKIASQYKEPVDLEEISEEDLGIPVIGAYSLSVRRKKILKYKQKVKKYRDHVNISRDFKGRSIAAKQKPRLNGKFSKKLCVSNN